MGDYHVHLHPHGPYTGEGPAPGQYPVDHIEAYVEHALANGADEIAFTEHFYRCVESAEDMTRHVEAGDDAGLAAEDPGPGRAPVIVAQHPGGGDVAGDIDRAGQVFAQGCLHSRFVERRIQLQSRSV